MKRRDYLLLTLLGLAVFMLVAAFQKSPGYMDADYYYAGGLQLATGHGFTEPTLWNYLDDPAGLPHASNTYWMPLASILASIVPAIARSASWFVIRLPFICLAACLPALTAALAYSYSSRRTPALISGLLAVFPGFYLPYLVTTDTFALYMLFGGVFFLVINRSFGRQKPGAGTSFVLGLLAGLLHLSRADGLLWLALALLSVILIERPIRFRFSYIFPLLSVCAGYVLVMGPWFMRNLAAFGSLLAPGGLKMIWLTSYDQIFAYPASQITFQNWLASGWDKILAARSWALGMNAATTLSVQGGIFLLPLIIIGLWVYRREARLYIPLIAWSLIFLAMTLVFPFAGARGGFFHSGAALQPVWWAFAPLGLERVIRWGKEKRGWNSGRAGTVFLGGLVGMALFLSGLVLSIRLPTWGSEDDAYAGVNALLMEHGKSADDLVIVSNPPGFNLISGNPAIAVPDGNPQTILDLSRRYGAEYLVLEKGSIPAGLISIYEHPQDYAWLTCLGEVEAARVFAIQP